MLRCMRFRKCMYVSVRVAVTKLCVGVVRVNDGHKVCEQGHSRFSRKVVGTLKIYVPRKIANTVK